MYLNEGEEIYFEGIDISQKSRPRYKRPLLGETVLLSSFHDTVLKALRKNEKF